MKIAIAADSKGEDSPICQQAGRAPYFHIIEDGKTIETISNPFAFGGGGAGLAVARMLHDKEVEKIIAGEIGPKMRAALEQANIEMEESQKKVADWL